MGEPFRLNNGTLMISTEAPGGLYNAVQLKKIAALCDTDAAVAKATEDQRLTLFVKPEQANTVVKELRAVGLGVRHYQDGIHQPVACVGALCPQFKQDALATAMDLNNTLRGITAKSPLKVGINGCGNCCVPTHTLDLSVIGDEAGYKVSMGGKNSQLPELAAFLAEGVPATEIGPMIGRLAKLHADHAEAGETFQAVVERIGSTPFVEIFAPYSQDASGGSAADPIGENQEASVLGEGTDLSLDESTDLDVDQIPEDLSVDTVSDQLEDLTAKTDDELGAVSSIDVDVSAESDLDLALPEEIGMQESSSGAAVEESIDVSGIDDLESDPQVSAEDDLALEDVAIEEIADLDLDEAGTADVAAENAAAAQADLESLNLDVDLADTPNAAPVTEVTEELGETSDLSADEVALEEVEAAVDEIPDLELDGIEPESIEAAPDTLNEAQEQDIELKLEEGIEEEKIAEAQTEQDEGSIEREEALRLVTNLEDTGEVTESTTELNANVIPEDDIDITGETDLDAIADDLRQVTRVAPTPSTSSMPKPMVGNRLSVNAFAGVEMQGNTLVLNFSSGMAVEVDPTTFAQTEQHFTVGDQNIRMQSTPDGIRVTINGLAITCPTRKAA